MARVAEVAGTKTFTRAIACLVAPMLEQQQQQLGHEEQQQ
jgi:hypothetical protein